MSGLSEIKARYPVLIVDDNPAHITTLAGVLETENIKHISCTTGGEALQICQDNEITLVILDLRLPDMTGLDILNILKQKNPNIRIIIHTGFSSLEVAMSSLNQGAFAFVEKGKNPEELLEHVNRAYLMVYNEFLEQEAQVSHHKLFRTQTALQTSLHQLEHAKTRLELLVEGTKNIAEAHDKYHAMVNAVNAILLGLPQFSANHVRLYFQGRKSRKHQGYSYFQFNTYPNHKQIFLPKLDSIKDILHVFTETTPSGLSEPDNIATQSSFKAIDKTFSLQIWHEQILLGLLVVDFQEHVSLTREDEEFIHTLAHSLATSLEKINFVVLLEKIIDERTIDLKMTLDIQAQISDSLLSKTQDLNVSRQRLEQQNMELLASNRKLEDLNQTKEQFLQKMYKLSDIQFPSLKQNIITLSEQIPQESQELRHEIQRQMYEMEESLRPFHSLYLTEKAVRNKRVLIAESDKKEQILAQMALRGTGMELDVVSCMEEGEKLIHEQKYDIICTNAELLDLIPVAMKKDPEILSLLMTSEDVSVYLSILKQYPFLSNIVTRNNADRTFTIKNIITTVSKLISGDLFGLEKYVSWGVDVSEFEITGSKERVKLTNQMEANLKQLGIRRSITDKCVLIAEELLMNSVYDAPVNADGSMRYNHLPRTQQIQLKPAEYARFRFACDGILIGISVEDPFGALTRQTILDYLESCYAGKAGSLNTEKGGAGRGLFQIMVSSDLMVINVKPQVRTEVIAILNVDPKISNDSHTSFHYFFG
ncbi:MAG: response regulator [SAR324 cluster bacterium]|nr:response regulator [SAR324 cluster bacterium]